MTISNTSEQLTVQDSEQLVVVDRDEQIWYCPGCGHVHSGMYGRAHAYCNITNTVFQLIWR